MNKAYKSATQEKLNRNSIAGYTKKELQKFIHLLFIKWFPKFSALGGMGFITQRFLPN